jgi:hypothetical protein
MSEEKMISKYDRLRGGLVDIALFTRASTIQNVETITGKSETFIVQTCRFEDKGGDFIFVQCVDETGVIRLALPPKVANAIAAQRDSLSTRRRSQAGKRLAQERKERGERPAFMKARTSSS